MRADELLDTARAWLQAQRPAVLVEVAATKGSAPRDAGTRMLVAADTVAGTIGGGHLEWRAIADARAWLLRGERPADAMAIGRTVATSVATSVAASVAQGQAKAVPSNAVDAGFVQHIALGPTLGQCCGGAVSLQSSLLASHHLDDWPLPAPRFALQLYGAGHVGVAVIRLLSALPCEVWWMDERDEAFTAAEQGLPALPPHIHRLSVDPVEAEVALAAPGTCFLVMTHSHELDMRLSEAILKRGDFAWFGLIGSRSKAARFARRLRDRGLPGALVERMVCPIGLPGIVGKEPEVLAISVVAQLMLAVSASVLAQPAR